MQQVRNALDGKNCRMIELDIRLAYPHDRSQLQLGGKYGKLVPVRKEDEPVHDPPTLSFNYSHEAQSTNRTASKGAQAVQPTPAPSANLSCRRRLR